MPYRAPCTILVFAAIAACSARDATSPPSPSDVATPTSASSTLDAFREETNADGDAADLRDGEASAETSAETEDFKEDAELDWQDEGFDADLDGDGKPESISWTCGDSSVIRVGRATFDFKRQFSDLIGCYAAAIDLDPKRPGTQLMFTADEHDEVGPDDHVFLSYSNGELTEIWSGAASVSIHDDGTWRLETGDCDEDDLVYRTTTVDMRWTGKDVASAESVSTEPVEPGDCAEP